jgi:hypothetical protein
MPGGRPIAASSEPTPAAPDGEVNLKQFEVTIDISKQLVTVAAAIITVTIAFSKDIVGMATIGHADRVLVGFAWGLFLVSVVAGLWCLYAANGSVSIPRKDDGTPRSIYDANVAWPMLVQQVAFLLAIVLTVVFGVRTM